MNDIKISYIYIICSNRKVEDAISEKANVSYKKKQAVIINMCSSLSVEQVRVFQTRRWVSGEIRPIPTSIPVCLTHSLWTDSYVSSEFGTCLSACLLSLSTHSDCVTPRWNVINKGFGFIWGQWIIRNKPKKPVWYHTSGAACSFHAYLLLSFFLWLNKSFETSPVCENDYRIFMFGWTFPLMFTF